MRILWRSSRLGMRALDLPDELVEQPARVVRPRPGLGVVLHAPRRDVEQAQALDRPVVEAHVGQLGLPGVARQQLLRGRSAREQLERGAARGEVADDRALDARVERRDPRAPALAGQYAAL